MWTCPDCANENLYKDDPDTCTMCSSKNPATLSQVPTEEVSAEIPQPKKPAEKTVIPQTTWTCPDDG